MPIHDWKRVPAGIFHHFHLSWIDAIAGALNNGILPDTYYAMAEQFAAGLGPDVLTLKEDRHAAAEESPEVPWQAEPAGGIKLARPWTEPTADTEEEFYRRKKNLVAVRHVSNDELVAVIEVLSPGNKMGRKPFQDLLTKIAALLEYRIHLLVVDLFPPTRRDPQGIHAAIWEDVQDQAYTPPPGKPLTLAAYECGLSTRAYVESVSVGDVLPDMPLFLQPGGQVPVPLERTYQTAWAAVPRRWRDVLETK